MANEKTPKPSRAFEKANPKPRTQMPRKVSDRGKLWLFRLLLSNLKSRRPRAKGRASRACAGWTKRNPDPHKESAMQHRTDASERRREEGASDTGERQRWRTARQGHFRASARPPPCSRATARSHFAPVPTRFATSASRTHDRVKGRVAPGNRSTVSHRHSAIHTDSKTPTRRSPLLTALPPRRDRASATDSRAQQTLPGDQVASTLRRKRGACGMRPNAQSPASSTSTSRTTSSLDKRGEQKKVVAQQGACKAGSPVGPDAARTQRSVREVARDGAHRDSARAPFTLPPCIYTANTPS